MGAVSEITVIILTFNEEANLTAALDSVKGWAKAIFVVDSYSTDKTVDLALASAAQGVCVVQHAFEDYSTQWNWALSHLPIESDWTLKLDADERVTPGFKEEVTRCLRTAPEDLEGIFFRRRMIFMDQCLKWGGSSSTYVLHLWRTGKAVFEDTGVNEHVLLRGRTRKIRSFVDHHDHKSLSDWLAKHNRYSSLEALREDLTGGVVPRLWGTPPERRMWLKELHSRLPARNLLYFLYQYVLCLGFLDRRAGFRMAFLRASFLYWIDLKRLEIQERGKIPEVTWPVRGRPHPVVATTELQSYVDRRARQE